MDAVSDIEKSYSDFVQPLLSRRMFAYDDFCRAVDLSVGRRVQQVEVCHSFEGRRISLLKFGHGNTVVLAWSQMHGNEPISTLALMDVISAMDKGLLDFLQDKVSVYMLPLLNPDGYIRNDRRNAQGIDINRDARDMVSPEAGLLMRVAREIKPDYGFNLHDQELYYTTRPRLLQTAVALLAPEFSFTESVSPARTRSMLVCGAVANLLDRWVPDRIAKYQDTYTPQAFGDTFMGMGISTVLIESGSVPGDSERLCARKMVCLAIMEALCVAAGISNGDEARYLQLPVNQRYNAFDIRLRNLNVCGPGYSYRVDVGIRRIKPSHNVEDFTDDSTEYRIVNIGNLAQNGAICDMDASAYVLEGGYSAIYVGCSANRIVLRNQNDNLISVKSLFNI